jgi:hypothetical protein
LITKTVVDLILYALPGIPIDCLTNILKEYTDYETDVVDVKAFLASITESSPKRPTTALSRVTAATGSGTSLYRVKTKLRPLWVNIVEILRMHDIGHTGYVEFNHFLVSSLRFDVSISKSEAQMI